MQSFFKHQQKKDGRHFEPDTLSRLEIAPVSGTFAKKDFAFATKISPLVAILRPFYSLASL